MQVSIGVLPMPRGVCRQQCTKSTQKTAESGVFMLGCTAVIAVYAQPSGTALTLNALMIHDANIGHNYIGHNHIDNPRGHHLVNIRHAHLAVPSRALYYYFCSVACMRQGWWHWWCMGGGDTWSASWKRGVVPLSVEAPAAAPLDACMASIACNRGAV